MHYSISNSPEAELDIQRAIDYYFGISSDLATRFVDELDATYEKIQTNPEFYKYLSKKRRRTFRCVQLKSFPFLVIYLITGSSIIVISVFNTYRNPIHGQP